MNPSSSIKVLCPLSARVKGLKGHIKTDTLSNPTVDNKPQLSPQGWFCNYLESLKGTNTQHSGHMGPKFSTGIMVEIYFKSLVRAKVLLMKFS